MKGSSSSPTGVGGSMARFAVSQDHLYAVDYSTLRVFDIAVPSDPIQGNEVEIGWDIETIFPYKENLFVGSTSGVFIYDNTNPEHPVFRSKFQHVSSCDPVVVDDQYAYVTLRSGNQCAGYTNQLDVLDITNLDNPVLVKSYPMDNPHGLSIDGNLLFITEGEFGMKVFDATDRKAIGDHMLDQITGIHGYDVIAFDKIAILIGDDGLYIFNYADPSNLDPCSIIPIAGGV